MGRACLLCMRRHIAFIPGTGRKALILATTHRAHGLPIVKCFYALGPFWPNSIACVVCLLWDVQAHAPTRNIDKLGPKLAVWRALTSLQLVQGTSQVARVYVRGEFQNAECIALPGTSVLLGIGMH